MHMDPSHQSSLRGKRPLRPRYKKAVVVTISHNRFLFSAFREGNHEDKSAQTYFKSFNSQPKALAPNTAASESFSSDINNFVFPL